MEDSNASRLLGSLILISLLAPTACTQNKNSPHFGHALGCPSRVEELSEKQEGIEYRTEVSDQEKGICTKVRDWSILSLVQSNYLQLLALSAVASLLLQATLEEIELQTRRMNAGGITIGCSSQILWLVARKTVGSSGAKISDCERQRQHVQSQPDVLPSGLRVISKDAFTHGEPFPMH
ncbi:14554b98-cb3f-4ef6-ae8c-1e45b2e74b39 [Sclerotinia trifoliorum]|uniref:14554b98-cb3f-4ef6-ae8c-1e45b2e74b39 n=1 Tax=Sclerotinia trifoliorum TaxID=28548 RepID=A0A8H2VWJ9_9HELO|nr:14554b98-cb3f-4ef6-ae8c-1e45b2e74b39 [Sclerotinia trifoliorum]